MDHCNTIRKDLKGFETKINHVAQRVRPCHPLLNIGALMIIASAESVLLTSRNNILDLLKISR
jgi:hypothetical protein